MHSPSRKSASDLWRERLNSAELVDAENDRKAVDWQKYDLQAIAQSTKKTLEDAEGMLPQLQVLLDLDIDQVATSHAVFTDALNKYLEQEQGLSDEEYDLLTDHLAHAYQRYVARYRADGVKKQEVDDMERSLQKAAFRKSLDWTVIKGDDL